MARPERNSVDYFPHPITHGKGMFYMRTKYGNDSYVVWFMLLEKLGGADYHYLDLQNKLQVMYLSAEFKVDESVLIEMITDLVMVSEDDFNSELWKEERILYNQKFVDSIADAYKKRSNSIIELSTLLRLLVSIGRIKPSKLTCKLDLRDPSAPIKPQSKVKYSKVDNRIVNEFESFWLNYHLITSKRKTDKDAAFKHWKKLTDIEQQKSIGMIREYFDSLSDKKYCKKARTYLADKNFNDEFQPYRNTQNSVVIKQFKAND
jgi:hypothetical protein